MQTFLPYESFTESAQCLDYRRLGKQRVEATQIIQTLEKGEGAWYNHPATQMWKFSIEALKLYCNNMISEWIWRGYKNNMPYYEIDVNKIVFPSWHGNKEFHSSHRAALLAKDFEYYKAFGWEETPIINYYWPTKIQEPLDK